MTREELSEILDILGREVYRLKTDAKKIKDCNAASRAHDEINRVIYLGSKIKESIDDIDYGKINNVEYGCTEGYPYPCNGRY